MHRYPHRLALAALALAMLTLAAGGCGADDEPMTPDGTRALAACGGTPRHHNVKPACSSGCSINSDTLIDPVARWRDRGPTLFFDDQGAVRVIYRLASDADPRATFPASAWKQGDGFQHERLPMDFETGVLTFDNDGTSWLITNSARHGFEQWTRSEAITSGSEQAAASWKHAGNAGAFPLWSGALARDGKGCLHAAMPLGADAAYGVREPVGGNAQSDASWWFGPLGGFERVALTLDEGGAAHVAGWSQDGDGWHIAYRHAGRSERVAGISSAAERGKVFIALARDELHPEKPARVFVLFASQVSQPWGATNKVVATLQLATRNGDGRWSISEISRDESAPACTGAPASNRDRCPWTAQQLEPLALLGGASLRLVLASLSVEGEDYARCDYLPGGQTGDCHWERATYNLSEKLSLQIGSLEAGGQIARTTVVKGLSSEHQLVGGSPPLRGDARVDADGTIHVVFNDRARYDSGSRVRYLTLR
ncbi:MAG: hypothetical protein KC503_15200 [Myxococcales bacterium]|nr:hypothetical protein [Myxococcales bacterium]